MPSVLGDVVVGEVRLFCIFVDVTGEYNLVIQTELFESLFRRSDSGATRGDSNLSFGMGEGSLYPSS